MAQTSKRARQFQRVKREKSVLGAHLAAHQLNVQVQALQQSLKETQQQHFIATKLLLAALKTHGAIELSHEMLNEVAEDASLTFQTLPKEGVEGVMVVRLAEPQTGANAVQSPPEDVAPTAPEVQG